MSYNRLNILTDYDRPPPGPDLMNCKCNTARSAGFRYLHGNMAKKLVKSAKKKSVKSVSPAKPVKLDRSLINPLKQAAIASAARRTLK